VYGVGSYMDQHPGGEEVIKEHAGIDATSDFQNVGHGPSALAKMRTLVVGKVPGARLLSDDELSGKEGGGGSAGLLVVILLLLIFGGYSLFNSAMCDGLRKDLKTSFSSLFEKKPVSTEKETTPPITKPEGGKPSAGSKSTPPDVPKTVKPVSEEKETKKKKAEGKKTTGSTKKGKKTEDKASKHSEL